MGVVYRARHSFEEVAVRQGGDVAIKVMHGHLALDDGFRARFEREVRLSLRLDYPGIVRAHEVVLEAGTLALVMELVEGKALCDRIGPARGPMPWQQALPLFEQLLDAVAHAHAAGVVHRDIKPRER